MLPNMPPINPNESVTPAGGQRPPDLDAPKADLQPLVEAGRQLLRENPRLTEVEFRNIMLERFRANDQRLQTDKRNMSASPGHGEADGVLAMFMLPWMIFRWLGWRSRLSRHRAEMDEVVRLLRRERNFGSEPA